MRKTKTSLPVQVPVPSPAAGESWIPPLFIRRGRLLQQVSPAQASAVMAIYRGTRGASEVSPIALYDADGRQIGRVAYNGRIFLRDVQGEIEVPTAGGNLPPILSGIKVIEAASDETPCFTATLVFEGNTFTVRNEGTGGGNYYFPPMPGSMMARLDRWAARTFPPITECGGCPVNPPLPMNFETWTFTRAFSLIPD